MTWPPAGGWSCGRAAAAPSAPLWCLAGPRAAACASQSLSPTADTFFALASTSQFRQVCQDARVAAGVHFRGGVTEGDCLCTGTADSMWGKVLALYPKLAGATC